MYKEFEYLEKELDGNEKALEVLNHLKFNFTKLNNEKKEIYDDYHNLIYEFKQFIISVGL